MSNEPTPSFDDRVDAVTVQLEAARAAIVETTASLQSTLATLQRANATIAGLNRRIKWYGFACGVGGALGATVGGIAWRAFGF